MKQWIQQLPKHWYSMVASTPGSLLLLTARFGPSNKHSFLFLNAIRTITASTLDGIPDVFRQVEEALADGFYVAGFVSYECGYHFERFEDIALATQGTPLAWFGVYRDPMIYDHEKGRFEGASALRSIGHASEKIPVRFADNVALGISEEEYCAKVRRIQDYILAGDTYQVNFTDRVSVPTCLSAAAAFEALLRHQPVAYSAFLNADGHHILSLSPELFFQVDQGRIVTRPMKGTMPRGLDSDEDAMAAARLQHDEKNRCEHVMIVDVLRNDLGRICTMGSVKVDDLFSVERYATLLQMTSTVSGTLRPGLTYYDIFKGLFPSGSITGAPKIRTMQIIREMESGPRGIYTGAIGFISPHGSSTFNVAIRTLVLQDGEAHMGVGGGIVADSDPADEYRECLLKAAFLTRRKVDFQLIETMLWERVFPFLSMHLDRLESSASYFEFPFDRAAITLQLMERSNLFQSGDCYRVGLLLDAAGKVTVSSRKLTPDTSTGIIRLSAERTSSRDVFLRHKTTRRELYERQYAEVRADGFDETIFLNERGEVTEGTISNVFLRMEGKLLTPPLSSGVLPGIFRRHLLETDATAEERVLTIHDLESADAMFLCNSVRGIRQVTSLCLDASFSK